MSTSTSSRLLSLDVMRGLTVMLMIVVNDLGGPAWEFLCHKPWNGITPCDCVFPFFLFMVGVSAAFSLSKYGYKATPASVWRIVRRTLGILLVAYGIYWLMDILHGDYWPFDHLRLTGVLQRLALSYCVASLLAITVNHKWFPVIIVALLAAYAVILLYGNGYANDQTNILYRTDVALLGEAHIYHGRPVDPEGILGLIPSVAHAMIGFLVGKLCKATPRKAREVKDAQAKARAALWPKVVTLLGVSGAMVTVGMLLTPVLPANKNLWSPTFVLITCGLAMLLLAVLMVICDAWKLTAWTPFFRAFGQNPLFLYAFHEVLAVALGVTGIAAACQQGLRTVVPDVQWASFIYAFLFMLVCWLVAWFLYKKKIIIKL